MRGKPRPAISRIFRVSLGLGAALLLMATTRLVLAIATTDRATDQIGSISQTEPISEPHKVRCEAPATLSEMLPNGVAAGDTTPTSTVLWARATATGTLLFELSTDPRFGTNVLPVTTEITDVRRPGKVRVVGLTPATTYGYRATDAAGDSAHGHFRTAPPPGERAGLRFGVSGDWEAQLAPYPSIANADGRDLDFFVEHGDTIVSGAATTLEEFWFKHQEVYSTRLGLNTWADLRSSTSILATADDNDVRNNYAGGAEPPSDPRFDDTGAFINETMLYKNAIAAFHDYNPIWIRVYGAPGDPRTAGKPKLYRFSAYGSDAAVFLLDECSFRDQQLPLDDPTDLAQIGAFLTRSLTDTSRTMLGAQQLADLKADLLQAQADDITWKFVLLPGPIQNLGLFHAQHRYEGYAAERTDLLRFLNQNSIDNVVFVAAGLHGTIVNNLTYQEIPFGEQIPTGAFEVIVGPVGIEPPYGPFGPVTVDLAAGYGLITPADRADYDGMSREGKDEFVRQLVDDKLLAPLGYDLTGLDGSEIEVQLLRGGYVAVHTYGWTEFEVGRVTQALTVTTYGVDYYTEEDLTTDPGDIITRTPAVVSQFVVTPKLNQLYLPLVVRD
jgi:3-phytase/alkaline phosphatase D